MTKPLLLAAAVFSASLPIAAALAQPPGRGGEHHPAFSAADAAAFMNARIAALKAGLAPTPAQEKLWPTFEAAFREFAKERAAGAAELREKKEEAREQHDMLAMMRAGGKALAARGAEMEKLADAAKPLYESLDEAQKRRFGVLLHMMRRPFGQHMGPGPHMGPGQHMGPGSRPGDEPDGKE